MDPIIETLRLRLTRLTDTSPDSQHLKWYHQKWSDPITTGWSAHGRCETIEESRSLMLQRVTGGNIQYVVHIKSADRPDADTKELEMAGSCGLRIQDSGPRLPPPDPNPEGKQLNFRVLGYAFFESTWGKGYATEACSALLNAYRSYCKQSESPEAPVVNYVEACLHPDNAGSIRVLEKLGFRRVGWGDEPEKVFYAGKWRDPGYWVYGMYV